MTRPTLDCEQVIAQIFDYLDHELDAERSEAIEQHLHQCKSCFSRKEFERRMLAKVGDLRREAVPDALNERIRGLLRRF